MMYWVKTVCIAAISNAASALTLPSTRIQPVSLSSTIRSKFSLLGVESARGSHELHSPPASTTTDLDAAYLNASPTELKPGWLGWHVAVIMSGWENPTKFAENWMTHVVEPILSDSFQNSVYMFLCFGPGQSGHEEVDSTSSWFSTARNYAVTVVPPKAYKGQLERIAGCYREANTYMDLHPNVAITHYLRARPDLYWHSRIPTLDYLSLDKVSLKVRNVFYKTPTLVPKLAFSAPKDVEDNRCGLGPWAERHGTRDDWRAEMANANITVCPTFDDQFAVVPYKFGDAFFEMEKGATMRVRPSLTGEFNYTNKYIESSKSFYGNVNPNALARTCSVAKATSWEGEFETWGGSYRHGGKQRRGKNSTDGADGAGGLCCESRFTWKLFGRLVPFEITPFDFRGPQPGGASGSVQC